MARPRHGRREPGGAALTVQGRSACRSIGAAVGRSGFGARRQRAHDIAVGLRSSIEQLGTVTASLGVATQVPSREGSAHDLVRMADEGMCEGKKTGRNRVVGA